MNSGDRKTFQAHLADSLNQLEFAKVVALIVGQTQTAYGRALAAALTPLADETSIRQALREAEEMHILLEDGGPLPLGAGTDLRSELGRLQTEGLRLEPAVLLEVQAVLEAVAICRKQLLNRPDCPIMQSFARRLTVLPELVATLKRSIGQRAEILDTASLPLADLRDGLKHERQRVRRTLERLLQDESLQGVFQESLITDRNGRYVLPVRVDHNSRLKGFVHDVSASGQTLYLEPAATLENNNRIQTLVHQITREEDRILKQLTASVRQVRQELLDNQNILARFDLRQAIARWSRSLAAVVPEIADRPCLELLNARHPLLVVTNRSEPDRPDVVPIDLRLAPDCDVLIISGPNTGGKTVTLKTAGLLVLMVRAGLPIPCDPGSRLFLFAPVMTDIGDQQSIEASLSTYSGHLTRWRHILQRADRETLVLLDELGSGTDPAEGSALALAMVDALRGQGACILATTHLHVIKGYAQLEEGVENAAVEFDTETLQPTYRLHYGIPGASHAFTIARRIGLPDALLQVAEGHLGEKERAGGAIVERLQDLRHRLEEQLDAAEHLRIMTEGEKRQVEDEREALEGRRQAILEEARQQGVKILIAAEKKLQKVFRSLPQDDVSPKQRAALTSSVRALHETLPEPVPQGPQKIPEEIAVDELLFVPALGIEARVTAVDNDRVDLQVGGKKLRQVRTDLRQFQPRRFVERKPALPKIRDRITRQAFRPRLVLVGKRVEEAQGMLARFLDDAMLHGEQKLEIVHGAGQGILRDAVRECLAVRPEVSTFHAARPESGGDNVTVVELQV